MILWKKSDKADHYFRQEAIWFLKLTLHNIKVVDGLCFHSLFCQPIRRETEEHELWKIIHLGFWLLLKWTWRSSMASLKLFLTENSSVSGNLWKLLRTQSLQQIVQWKLSSTCLAICSKQPCCLHAYYVQIFFHCHWGWIICLGNCRFYFFWLGFLNSRISGFNTPLVLKATTL